MGRQSEKSIFDAETINTISIRGLGKIYPNKQNTNAAHCANCRQQVSSGKGYTFKAERFGRMRSGYLCTNCITAELQRIQEWFFNKYFEILQPTVFDTARSFDGGSLADAWAQGGIEMLFERVSAVKA